MKSTVADYQTRVFCVRIVGVDATTVRFTDYPFDLTMSNSVVYASDSGYDATGFSATADGSPSVIDLQGILAAAGISKAGIESGTWDNAKAFLFATSWATPVEDDEPIAKFILGKFRMEDDRYVCELMHLIDAVNQSVGRSHGPLCPWTLFDETLDGEIPPANRSRCTGPRAAPDGPALTGYKITGTVTGVTSTKVWQDSALVASPLTYATDYFAAGSIRFTTGDNAGLRSQEVKSYNANGTVTQWLAWPNTIQIGDAYEMVPGCRKRRDEDCVAKYNNVINFGGFPDMIPPSAYQKIGTGG